MCQGICPSKSGQQGSQVEAELRLALLEIQTMANQQLQALQALRGPDDQPQPAAFALRLIATRAEAAAAIVPTPAPAPALAQSRMMMHVPYGSKCGCRSTADCNCMAMDTMAGLLYQSHQPHRHAG